ncbi:MAG TPA: acyl-CoA dehydrogenase family protein [Mycobacteriales bacterium]|nr:acyl-CoA dehydrogenase family protein [Mycobacteriales bacterium]
MTTAAPPRDLLAATASLCAELAAEARRLERDGVTRADVQRLADAGLMAVHGPPELGGATPAQQRQVAELLAGASPDAWFVWYQHGPVVRFLAASENEALKARWLPPLCRGEALGGVAWSNLRTARPSVSAVRAGTGWALTGPQPWCTGWGMHDALFVGGRTVPDHGSGPEVVFGIVPADRPGLVGLGELELAAMGGTSTHAVRYEGLVLDDDEVILRKDFAAWAEGDAVMNRNVQPSTFGVALAALDLLEPASPAVAAALRERVLDVRERAYRLMDDVDPAEAGDERLALRGQALVLGVEACTALVASRGGRGMGLDDPAQRLLRAAAFQLVHAQAAHVREATLTALAG